jgi:hypothetical protein
MQAQESDQLYDSLFVPGEINEEMPLVVRDQLIRVNSWATKAGQKLEDWISEDALKSKLDMLASMGSPHNAGVFTASLLLPRVEDELKFVRQTFS